MTEFLSNAQVCETCQQGKQTKLSCQASQVWRTNQKSQLIHMDIFGLMKTDSMSSNKYFLLFIKDCTWMCWVYFIKPRVKFLMFLNSLKLQQKRKINVISILKF